MKISVLSLLLIAGVFGVMLLTGCDEGMQMMKPAIEKPMPPEMDPEGSVGLTKEEAREKARGIVIDTVYARQILINPVLDLPGDESWKARSAIDDDLTRILLEKTGFTWAQVIQLVEVHLEENAHEAALAEGRIVDSGFYLVSWVDVVAKYLEITFRYPTKMEDEILELFREYARDGETTLSVEDVEANYFSVESADPPDSIRRTDDGQLLLTDLTTFYIGYNPLDPTQEVPDKFLPLITPRYPELEPGKYRIKPQVIRGERGHYISDIFVEYSPEEYNPEEPNKLRKHIRVIIEFTSDTPELKLNWGADGDEAILPGNEIVVEILRKTDELTYIHEARVWGETDEVKYADIEITDHIYEARPIRNLSRPEIVFEFSEFVDAADLAAE